MIGSFRAHAARATAGTVGALSGIALAALVSLPASSAGSIELDLPAACEPGKDCFFQQFPDMDPGSGATDPFCGHATFDGHKGTDLRLLSMADMARGVPVLAMSRGTVLRTRDGMPDRIIDSDAERAAVAGRECGNGIVVAHAGGFETQYCHMKRGSLAVKSGDGIEPGRKLGEIGASGMVQFPHVHVEVRRGDQTIDPSTGRAITDGCAASAGERHPLFSPDVMAAIDGGGTGLLAFGLAGNVVEHGSLVRDGPPPPPTGSAAATVAWGWFANLDAGDRISIRMEGPEGTTIIEHTSDRIERTKADFSAYAGKRGAPAPGRYKITVSLLRDGRSLIERTKTVTVVR